MKLNNYFLGVIFSITTLCGCGIVDSSQRYLPVRELMGDVLQTSLTDDELGLQGASVIYRFKSVPNLVYLKSGAEPVSGNLLYLSEDFSREQEQAKKTFLVEPKKIISLDSVVSGQKPPFEFDGFSQAQKEILDSGVVLSSVNVAVIDSGVVPVTEYLKNALAFQLNLTTDFNPAKWQTHATAIGSIFSGMTRHVKLENSYAPNVKIQSIKISFQGDPENSQRRDLGAIQLSVAIDEAVSKGAQIVNLSFAYRDTLPPQISSLEKYLIAQANKKGVLFISAAGNSEVNTDIKKSYPAGYDLSNIIVVGNHTNTGRHVKSSNFGRSVDITACGNNLALTSRAGEYEYFSGTSFSAPVVASAIALYLGLKPTATITQTLVDLYSSAQPSYVQNKSESGPGKNMGQASISRYGRLDAAALVKLALQ